MPFHLLVELAGFGAHPAAWRLAPDPRSVFTGRHQRAVVRRAEQGGVDAVTLTDTFGPRPADPGELRGGLEALTLAAALAPATERIGVVPTVTVTHSEPFHVGKNLATLDHVSRGRSGWLVAVSATEEENRLVGRRPLPSTHELHREAADVVEVVGRLCDSWEDDAIIRDLATGRYIDRDKLHYVDFSAPTFSVRGPSITPRPPQGRPVVVAEVRDEPSARLAARVADVACVERAGGPRWPLGDDGRVPPRTIIDVTVLLGRDDAAARRRLEALDALTRAQPPVPTYVGGPVGFVTLLRELASEGDGVRVRPSVALDDLDVLVDNVVPELRRLGLRPPGYAGSTLRGHLGLERPANSFATTP